jgi:hypothetical protein
MCPAAIYGYSSSGKTVFLGLLYAAQTRYTNEQRGESFRFYGDPSTIRQMGSMFNAMRNGRFPPANLKEEMTEIRFKFGFPRGLAQHLPEYIRKADWVKPFSVIDFAAYDVAGEDVEEFVETGVTENRRVIQELLKSHIIVFIVDCSRFTTVTSGSLFDRMLDYDKNGAVLLSSLAKHKADETKKAATGKKVGGNTIYPVLVLSKFDQVSGDVLNQLGLPTTPPPVSDPNARQKFGDALMTRFLPQMFALLKGGRLMGVNFDRAAYYYSWIQTQQVAGMDTSGKPQIERDPKGDPRFAYDEYRGFIEYFRELAGKAPDDVEDAQKVPLR